MESREKMLIMKKHLKVKALPEFIKLFKTSCHVSCNSKISLMYSLGEKGRSHILSSRTRKRRHEEMMGGKANDKLHELEKERDILMSEIMNMKNEMAILESMKIEHLEDRERLAVLFNEGLIVESGNIIGGR